VFRPYLGINGREKEASRSKSVLLIQDGTDGFDYVRFSYET